MLSSPKNHNNGAIFSACGMSHVVELPAESHRGWKPLPRKSKFSVISKVLDSSLCWREAIFAMRYALANGLLSTRPLAADN
jgi:hypothetical protein